MIGRIANPVKRCTGGPLLQAPTGEHTGNLSATRARASGVAPRAAGQPRRKRSLRTPIPLLAHAGRQHDKRCTTATPEARGSHRASQELRCSTAMRPSLRAPSCTRCQPAARPAIPRYRDTDADSAPYPRDGERDCHLPTRSHADDLYPPPMLAAATCGHAPPVPRNGHVEQPPVQRHADDHDAVRTHWLIAAPLADIRVTLIDFDQMGEWSNRPCRRPSPATRPQTNRAPSGALFGQCVAV